MNFNDPGKYDDVCTKAREETEAESVLLIVIKGKFGSGFSIQATGPVLFTVPDMLEDVAKQIRADIKKATS